MADAEAPKRPQTEPQKPAPDMAAPILKQASPIDLFLLEKQYPDVSHVLRPQPKIEDIVKRCVFVFDASALIAPFEVGADGAEKIGQILLKLAQQKRLFVPAQALREYARNRSKPVQEVFQKLQTLNSTLPSMQVEAMPLLGSLRQYKRLKETVTKLKPIREQIAKDVQELMDIVRDWNWDDPVSQLYSKVFVDDAIIHHSHPEEWIKKEMERRKANAIPPGFKDSGVGDLVNWLSVLDLARSKKSDVAFVSGDLKSDWMVRSEKEALFPRHELVEEFYCASQGQDFCLLTLARFLELEGASEEVVEEVKANIPLPEPLYLRFNRILKLTNKLISLLTLTKPSRDRLKDAIQHLSEVFYSIRPWSPDETQMLFEIAIATAVEVSNGAAKRRLARRQLGYFRSKLRDQVRAMGGIVSLEVSA